MNKIKTNFTMWWISRPLWSYTWRISWLNGVIAMIATAIWAIATKK